MKFTGSLDQIQPPNLRFKIETPNNEEENSASSGTAKSWSSESRKTPAAWFHAGETCEFRVGERVEVRS